MPMRVLASCASADLSCRGGVELGLRRLQAGRRDELLRRQPDVGRVLALGLGVCRLGRLDGRRRSLTRDCRSDRSIVPSVWPARTRLPSPTPSETSVPAALERARWRCAARPAGRRTRSQRHRHRLRTHDLLGREPRRDLGLLLVAGVAPAHGARHHHDRAARGDDRDDGACQPQLAHGPSFLDLTQSRRCKQGVAPGRSM